MSPKSLQWIPQDKLELNVNYARQQLEFLERDFKTIIEYVALDEKQLNVYSFRLADLIVRTGPEILRLFDLYLFNPNRSQIFHLNPESKKILSDLQIKKNSRQDKFMDYLRTFRTFIINGLNWAVEVKPLNKFVTPFATETRENNDLQVEFVFWWEDGYNALRHNVIERFNESATLGHALFSLAGLWILHDFIDRDWGRVDLAKSDIFGRITHISPDIQQVDYRKCAR
jgi:hypothetical protein